MRLWTAERFHYCFFCSVAKQFSLSTYFLERNSGEIINVTATFIQDVPDPRPRSVAARPEADRKMPFACTL